MRNKIKNTKGITLIALVITIIILIILTGTTIALISSDNGIFQETFKSKEETNKKSATEKINLKITTAQIDVYGTKQRMPTLKELSLALKEDEEIAYVTETSKVASVDYNVASDNPSSIYTKLKEYPYEFEIDSSLKLSAIDGVKLANNSESKNIDKLEAKITEMQATINSLDTRLTNLTSMYDNINIKNYKSGTVTIPACSPSKAATVDVNFSEPFQNTNYAVSILSLYNGSWWAQTSYTVVNKTVNGFTITCYNTGSNNTTAHSVDWLVVPKTQ